MDDHPAAPDKPSLLDQTAFHDLCVNYLDSRDLGRKFPPTRELLTLLRQKILKGPGPNPSTSITELISRWNAAQPVYKLPPELIALIVTFELPVFITLKASDKYVAVLYMKEMAALASVSRMWRETIIGTSRLWGILSTLLPPHINHLSLKRSAECPLTIQATEWPDETQSTSTDDLLDMALPHWSRCSNAQFHRIPLPRLLGHLEAPAPLLDALLLWGSPRQLQEPIDLFAGHAPNLRDVEVYRVRILVNPDVFRGLCHLVLQSVKNAIPLDSLFTCLTASPALEWLKLSCLDILPASLPPQEPIVLLHLGVIIVEDLSSEFVVQILPFIRAPTCKHLTLRTYGQIDEQSFGETYYLDRCLLHFDSLFRLTLASVGSSEVSIDINHFLWNTIDSRFVSSYSPPDPYFFITLPCRRLAPVISFISPFLSPPSEQPYELSLIEVGWGYDYADDPVGLDALVRLPNVTTLKLEDPSAFELVLGLLGGSTEGAMRSPESPVLNELRLHEGSEWKLSELERMLERRYAESWEGEEELPPISVVLQIPISRLERWPGLNVRFDDLARIETMRGVKSVRLEAVRMRGGDGILACIYDEDLGI
ncbi:hypothetical protein FRB90_004300 [Tulasnella sp. 427]|nr:hypothetical protein FRB90_004300 [Tulasnella sp. 427]